MQAQTSQQCVVVSLDTYSMNARGKINIYDISILSCNIPLDNPNLANLVSQHVLCLSASSFRSYGLLSDGILHLVDLRFQMSIDLFKTTNNHKLNVVVATFIDWSYVRVRNISRTHLGAYLSTCIWESPSCKPQSRWLHNYCHSA